MTRSFAGCTSDRAVSSIVAMVIVLAILSVAIPVFLSNFVPHYVKTTEVQRYGESEESFLRIAEFYPHSCRLKVPLGEQTPFGFIAATSLGIESSGVVNIEAVCENGVLDLNCSIPSLHLRVIGRSIPNRTLIFSEGGVAVEQQSERVIIADPEITLVHNTTSLLVAVDCLESEKKISGSGSAVVDVIVQPEVRKYANCTGRIYVNDTVFQSYWIESMGSTSLPVSGSRLDFSNLNLTIALRRVGIKV